METIFDVLERQGRSALLPETVISAILGQFNVAISNKRLSCEMAGGPDQKSAQMRGPAMGQRLASSLAIAFMSKVEAPVMDLRLLLYYSNKCMHRGGAESKSVKLASGNSHF
ncbi:hypothetical protein KIN20_030260 [Parelaphostrongylus tenuis]|uniref:Uncharacterized protein n=1 Tax=Parelaphostrongylus tenuis TaxID=148309 RepID=A0AAD5WGQ0_PARTN|nr:hypothetical protein KIN20_030260 [Parelaphostrongylus tenuis]